MLDVVFNETAKLFLSNSQVEDDDGIPYQDGNNEQNILCIGFHLDIGEIRSEIEGRERRHECVKLNPSMETNEEEMNQFMRRQKKDFQTLISEAGKGKSIRIWKSDTPSSVSGLAFVCYALRHIDCKITVVPLPEFVESEGTLVSYSDWSEVPPKEMHTFLSFERELHPFEKGHYSMIWDDLRKENAPLRAVVNGQLISVPEDFYDHIILKTIPDKEFEMQTVVGELMGYSLGVTDSWFIHRINELID